MTDTHKRDTLASLQYEADLFRKALAERGFVDDGSRIRGRIDWESDTSTRSALVDVAIPESFPFAPPSVTIVESSGITPTFHIETNGNLCLWTTEFSVEEAPWLDVDKFIDKVAGWFKASEEGWPSDGDADLERYLESDLETILIYEKDKITPGKFHKTTQKEDGVVLIKEALRWTPSSKRQKSKGVRRRERDTCFIIDIGQVSHPIRNWEDLIKLAGRNFQDIGTLVQLGSVKYILVIYKRGEREAALALGINKQEELISHESADASIETLSLRAGTDASLYKSKKVIIVGMGAIGSSIASLLFKSGVRKMTFVDPERLRPGNIIRHAANGSFVGQYKVMAVKNELAKLGLNVEEIKLYAGRINDPGKALDLLKGHDLVIDTTADNRASSVIWWCADKLKIPLISAVLQRSGGIARVDRFPLWDGEDHLPAVPLLPGAHEVYEQGCGSPVSTTPPISVAKAASLASNIILDQLKMIPSDPTDPATTIEVIIPQSDPPYDKVGILTSERVE